MKKNICIAMILSFIMIIFVSPKIVFASEDNFYVPYKINRLYEMNTGVSLNWEYEIYYTKEQIDIFSQKGTDVIGYLVRVHDLRKLYDSETKVTFVGEEMLDGKLVYHYHLSQDTVNKKHSTKEDAWVDYDTLILQDNADGVVFNSYYLANVLGEYGDTDDKCYEPFYIRYGFKVAKANGEIQPDGYTVKYTGLVGVNKMEDSAYNRIWAASESGVKGGSVTTAFTNNGYHNYSHFTQREMEYSDGTVDISYDLCGVKLVSGLITGIYPNNSKYSLRDNSEWFSRAVDDKFTYKIEYASGKTETLSFTLDNTMPQIKKQSDTNDGYQTYTVKDANLSLVKVNGKKQKISKGKVKLKLKSGTYTIVAKDKAGNTVQKEVNVASKLKKAQITFIKSPKKQRIQLKWKKNKNIDGYQIQYATDKKFKKNKKNITVNKKTTKYTIKKLKTKKTYYVRIRSYKKEYGDKTYSPWSAKRTVKVK